MLPEFREYERTLTACMNSYVRPQVAAYVDRLQTALRDLGVQSELDILRSDAGVMTPREAARNPVYGVLSGPSGGVAGALHVAARAGFPNILTFDMGGTSTDVSLCQAGEPTIGRETSIGQFRDQGPVGRRAHGRRGRRLDRPRAGADARAARRPGVGRRRARARGLRARRRRRRRSPTPTSSSAICRRA